MNWEEQHQPRFRAIARKLPAHAEKVLNVGAEPFACQREIIRALPHAEHHGICLGDSSQETEHIVDVTGRWATPVAIRECNVEADRWPFQSGSMDVVVMGAILEHLLDPVAALSEARRVLTDNGTLVLSTPNATRLLTRARVLMGVNPFDGLDHESIYHRHNREWTASEVVDLLDSVGFRTEVISEVNLHREGLAGWLYREAARALPGCGDQIVIRAGPAQPSGRPPAVYRESVVRRTET